MGERKHGIKLMEYQTKRGGRVVFQDIAKPSSTEWGSPAEAMEAALELEKTVNQSLLDLHKSRTPRVTRTCATSWRRSISGSRWRGSRTSGTGSSRSSALETVWVCILWTR